jgi:hypothetical protein
MLELRRNRGPEKELKAKQIGKHVLYAVKMESITASSAMVQARLEYVRRSRT